MKRKLLQYELFTSRQSKNDMPFPVFAKDKKSALRQVIRKLRKGERIISLRRSYW